MIELPIPDRNRLNASIGWIMLGNAKEALAELNRISVEFRQIPEVLDLEWEIYALEKDWMKALDVARVQIQKNPENVNGWIHQAYALRRVDGGGLEKARESLSRVVKLFPEEPIIPYNLACYAAQLGLYDEALDWFRCACERGDANELKKMGLADPDLKPIIEKIRNL
jgi:tetratricopeptide (TPR) repeat protein